MEIEKLLKAPESKTLEFKRDLSSMQPILKTIVAFANTAGGTLVVGMASDGALVGIPDIFRAEEMLASTIADTIHPPILPEIEIVTIEGKNLLIVKVSYWRGPFYLKSVGMPLGVYVRLGSTSRPAGPDLLAELQRTVLHRSYDEEPLPELTINSLDLEKAERFFKKVKRTLDQKKLRSLGILVPYAKGFVPSIGGLILFGRQEERMRFIPDARVSCARFLGDDKTEILDRYEVEGTILDAVEEVPKFIARNTRLSSEIRSMQRRDIPEYSPIAVREVLINALAHTDYSVTGSRIQIAIFNNGLEVQNPGMLPFGFTLEDLRDGVSRVRNRVIARVFSELNLMEEWGSGYKRIVEACHSEGYIEPEWKELGAAFRVIFKPHSQTKLDQVILEGEALTQRQQTILDLFAPKEPIAFRQIKEKLPGIISERSLRYDLTELRKRGLLDAKGKGRGVLWERRN